MRLTLNNQAGIAALAVLTCIAVSSCSSQPVKNASGVSEARISDAISTATPISTPLPSPVGVEFYPGDYCFSNQSGGGLFVIPATQLIPSIHLRRFAGYCYPTLGASNEVFISDEDSFQGDEFRILGNTPAGEISVSVNDQEIKIPRTGSASLPGYVFYRAKDNQILIEIKALHNQ